MFGKSPAAMPGFFLSGAFNMSRSAAATLSLLP
jgi:hypothetical protein